MPASTERPLPLRLRSGGPHASEKRATNSSRRRVNDTPVNACGAPARGSAGTSRSSCVGCRTMALPIDLDPFELVRMREEGKRVTLVDCREQWEHDLVHLPDSLL